VPGVSLHELITALANAVTEAQDRVERFQVANLQRYFDENQRPIRIEVRVPSLSPEAQPGDEQIIAVPLLAVVGMVRLAIKDVEISMEIDIGDLTALETGQEGTAASSAAGRPPAASPEERRWGEPAPRRVVTVDVQAPRARDRPAMAKVTLRVESQDPTEGFARLLLLLNQRIGPIAGPAGGGPTERSTEKS
jgi:Protein of unknown function (DUF2589)